MVVGRERKKQERQAFHPDGINRMEKNGRKEGQRMMSQDGPHKEMVLKLGPTLSEENQG